MAAIFTTADRDAVKAAIVTAATEGIASVSVAGQSVQSYTLEQLHKLLTAINADLTGDAMNVAGNQVTPFRMVKTVPPGAG